MKNRIMKVSAVLIAALIVLGAAAGYRYTKARHAQSAKDQKNGKLVMKINDRKVNVSWKNNKSVRALKKMAMKENMTINMSEYGGFEQVGNIGKTLPSADKKTVTSAGDIVLYSGDKMVIFYGSNTWGYTRLGRIKGKSEKEIKKLLNGDVTVTISLQK